MTTHATTTHGQDAHQARSLDAARGPRPLRVTICWTSLSGYMAACWKALAARPGVEVFVAVRQWRVSTQTAFDAALMHGLEHQLVDDDRFEDALADIVVASRPDVVVLCGWHEDSMRRLPELPALAHCKFVMTMDTPWKGDLRQKVGRYIRASYFRHMSRVVVAGERAWLLARQLGFEESQILRGVYGYDEAIFDRVMAERRVRNRTWPRRFVFMGRYSPEKALDVLLEAYARYRREVPHGEEPWTLDCCGKGELAPMLQGRDGVRDLGFVQPANQATVLADAGCFVLPSRYEPWGVVIAEAGASGLPIICSESCGAGVDLVQHMYNGYRVATDSVEELARAMAWMHAHYAHLPEVGARSQALAAAYNSQRWADRWLAMLLTIARERMAQAAP